MNTTIIGTGEKARGIASRLLAVGGSVTLSGTERERGGTGVPAGAPP
ncbi:MAG: hypothetical protein AVDCRST_MAG14-1921 [uncultured Rubrobacteraceae bacterium]|uniref:Pyrroline-5-carboxylate reductase catalytic N-terminal domain-containing protein n=1 Tax=uncultured Rubrobacteraceae bacterium TaxID=349277 RepID=A0A6J4QZA5_9ACTN|nr:MAG: hypothetical protein AVDCRST_MAG14-1921 [uncultured Rubrobacteraceae bacterium]